MCYPQYCWSNMAGLQNVRSGIKNKSLAFSVVSPCGPLLEEKHDPFPPVVNFTNHMKILNNSITNK